MRSTTVLLYKTQLELNLTIFSNFYRYRRKPLKSCGSWLAKPGTAGGDPVQNFFQVRTNSLNFVQFSSNTHHSIENLILNKFSPVTFSHKIDSFRDFCEKRVPTGKVSKIHKIVENHFNASESSPIDREFHGEQFTPAHEYTFSGEKWEKNRFEICRKKISCRPPL